MTGEEIKALRTKLGWTQLDLAKHIGTSLPSINNWESGRSNPLPVYRKKLERLAKRV
jgi:transcriptional regulator with XRE-family HTH domain